VPDTRDARERLVRAARDLKQVAEQAAEGAADREDLDAAIAETIGAETALFGPRPRARRGQGGKPRILAYLRAHVGEVVTGEELRAAAGFIGEWARRVRELSVEDGYDIDELGGSTYRLNSLAPDQQRADEWRLLNTIRRMDTSGTERLKRLFETHVGRIVDGPMIAYVGRISSAQRRIRELRDEQGWPINSHIDEPGLRPGEYRLLSVDAADRRDVRQRLYEEGVRELVFARDGYTCQVCGRNRERALAAGDTRFYLEIHHRTAVAEELDALPSDELNRPHNLVTLCHADHLRETAELQRRRRERRRSQ
jgi:5-methylcytosine-specific restriction endonuclease McrA